jgi:CheY-like chemotaxis protein
MMAKKPYLLLVEDDPDWASLYEEILRDGFIVLTVSSVRDAHRLISQRINELAFAIVDIRLAGKEDRLGVGVLQELTLHGVPCVATTAYDDTDARAIRDALVKGRAWDVWFKSTLSKSEILVETSRILKATQNTSVPQNDFSDGRISMSTPLDQLQVGILIEATKFLFGELGRRLQFWREKKGEIAAPKKIEPERQTGKLVVKFDDIERLVKAEAFDDFQEDIEASIKRIRRLKSRLRTFEDEASRPLRPEDKEVVNLNIEELSKQIEQESNRLQDRLERVYGDSPSTS